MQTIFTLNQRFTLYGHDHLFALLFIVLVWVQRKKWIHQKGTHLFLTTLFLLQQFLLYYWYYKTDSWHLQEALPLYPCRLFQIMNIILLFYDSEKIYQIVTLLGIPSAVVALLYADTGGNGFPSALYLQYFIGHSLMIFVPLYLKNKRHYTLDQKVFKTLFVFLLSYFVLVYNINQALGSNYGYLMESPAGILSSKVPSAFYMFLYFTFYYLSTMVSYQCFKRINWEV